MKWSVQVKSVQSYRSHLWEGSTNAWGVTSSGSTHGGEMCGDSYLCLRGLSWLKSGIKSYFFLQMLSVNQSKIILTKWTENPAKAVKTSAYARIETSGLMQGSYSELSKWEVSFSGTPQSKNMVAAAPSLMSYWLWLACVSISELIIEGIQSIRNQRWSCGRV